MHRHSTNIVIFYYTSTCGFIYSILSVFSFRLCEYMISYFSVFCQMSKGQKENAIYLLHT